MTNSLIYGPDILLKIGKNVVLRKEFEYKQKGRIKIGIGAATSQTTFPEKAENYLKEDAVFIDCAGILDSRGEEYDLVNGMIMGALLKCLKTARLIHVISRSDIGADRAGNFKKGLEMIDGMC